MNQSYIGERPDVVAAVPKNARYILDVGCSNGTVGASLRRQDNQRVVIGIENDELLATEAATKLTEVVKGDLNAFEYGNHFSENSFDCIIFADILEHLADPWTSLKKAVSLLQPEGSVVISVPNVRHLTAIYAIFFHGSFPRRHRGLFDATHLRWFTFSDVKALCQNSGLRIVDVNGNLRLFDLPGGEVNRRVERLLGRFSSSFLVREFLAYQFVVRAIRDKT